MSESVELSTLDLRYQGHRLRDDAREARLLASIAERGIDDPLEGVDAPDGRFLLNGFKRYRCAGKLGIPCARYLSLGPEEATGILQLMRMSRDKALGMLEQARFIVDLCSTIKNRLDLGNHCFRWRQRRQRWFRSVRGTMRWRPPYPPVPPSSSRA